MPRRHELTDAQWGTPRDLPPGRVGDHDRTAADNWQFVNAVLLVPKAGMPWEDTPALLPKAEHGRETVRPLMCGTRFGTDRQGSKGTRSCRRCPGSFRSGRGKIGTLRESSGGQAAAGSLTLGGRWKREASQVLISARVSRIAGALLPDGRSEPGTSGVIPPRQRIQL